MNNVAIVYWSGTGNTEAMADLISQALKQRRHGRNHPLLFVYRRSIGQL